MNLNVKHIEGFTYNEELKTYFTDKNPHFERFDQYNIKKRIDQEKGIKQTLSNLISDMQGSILKYSSNKSYSEGKGKVTLKDNQNLIEEYIKRLIFIGKGKKIKNEHNLYAVLNYEYSECTDNNVNKACSIYELYIDNKKNNKERRVLMEYNTIKNQLKLYEVEFCNHKDENNFKKDVINEYNLSFLYKIKLKYKNSKPIQINYILSKNEIIFIIDNNYNIILIDTLLIFDNQPNLSPSLINNQELYYQSYVFILKSFLSKRNLNSLPNFFAMPYILIIAKLNRIYIQIYKYIYCYEYNQKLNRPYLKDYNKLDQSLSIYLDMVKSFNTLYNHSSQYGYTDIKYINDNDNDYFLASSINNSFQILSINLSSLLTISLNTFISNLLHDEYPVSFQIIKDSSGYLILSLMSSNTITKSFIPVGFSFVLNNPTNVKHVLTQSVVNRDYLVIFNERPKLEMIIKVFGFNELVLIVRYKESVYVYLDMTFYYDCFSLFDNCLYGDDLLIGLFHYGVYCKDCCCIMENTQLSKDLIVV